MGGEDFTALLEQTTSALKKETLKRTLKEISLRIKESEKTGQEDSLKELQKQFKEVSVKLKNNG